MTKEIDAETLEPLLAVAEEAEDVCVRIAALDAATRFPLNEDGWRDCASAIHRLVLDEPEGSVARRTALEMAVRVPLMSVRSALRRLAEDASDPDRDVVQSGLERAGDPSRIAPLLQRAEAGDEDAFQRLSAMPLEDDAKTAASAGGRAGTPSAPSPEEVARRIRQLVVEGNRRALNLPEDLPANVVLGNDILDQLPPAVNTRGWPVAELALAQLQAPRTALDNGQMAWIIARDEPDHVIREITGLLTPDRIVDESLTLIEVLAGTADYYSGRAGSPWRGAGPGGGEVPVGRGPLIDDTPHAAAVDRGAPGVRGTRGTKDDLDRGAAPGEGEKESDPTGPVRSQPAEERRRVHACILHSGKRRNTFLTGACNVVRCWIGLPEPERAAVSEMPIPETDIPPTGLPLSVELGWRDQSERKDLLLPPDRTARTRDCDFHIRVPDGERYICAEVMFRYKGRVFESVRVEAFALAPGEEEQPGQEVRVRVDVSERKVIELPGRSDYDATIVWGESPSHQNHSAPSGLLVFGGEGGKRYDLSDAATALDWLNKSLFITTKSLVRRREAVSPGEKMASLQEDDALVLALLRDLARHGAAIYTELRSQGFRDPGERIQLLNRNPAAYVPLEFVYDRGYPADEARLCDTWKEALLSEGQACPGCSRAPLTEEQMDWAPTICPLGFWSLQKIIERLDPQTGASNGLTCVPKEECRNLRAIDTALFASSHHVPVTEREATWELLQQSFDHPVYAENW